MDPFWGGQNDENTRKTNGFGTFPAQKGINFWVHFWTPLFQNLIKINGILKKIQKCSGTFGIPFFCRGRKSCKTEGGTFPFPDRKSDFLTYPILIGWARKNEAWQKWDPEMDPFWEGQNGENTRKTNGFCTFPVQKGCRFWSPFWIPLFQKFNKI